MKQKNRNINVCLVDIAFNKKVVIDGFNLFEFDSSIYFKNFVNKIDLLSIIKDGINSLKIKKILNKAEGIDSLLRNKNSAYLNFIDGLYKFVEDNQIEILVSSENKIHPQIIKDKFNHTINIMGMIDDPYVTYSKTIPYSWAFDGVFYISPSQHKNILTKDFLAQIGVKHTYWKPMGHFGFDFKITEDFFEKRINSVIYVGNPTLRKKEFLIKSKLELKSKFKLHGKWKLNGFESLTGILNNEPFLFSRIKPINNLKDFYSNHSIGLNLHVSEKIETGNIRMYELPASGVMQLCDKSALNTNELIFKNEEEIIYYDDFKDFIEKANYFLNNPKERIRIAEAGYHKAQKLYNQEKIYSDFLNWAKSLDK